MGGLESSTFCCIGRLIPPCEGMSRAEGNAGQFEPLTQQVSNYCKALDRFFAYRLSHHRHLVVDRNVSNAYSWSSSDEGVDVPCGTISSTSVASDLYISNLTRGLWMSIFSILCVGNCPLSGLLWY